MSQRVLQTVFQPVDVLFRPSRLVEGHVSNYSANTVQKLRVLLRLTIYFGLNLVLYAVPLTLAGYGVESTADAPPAFSAYLAPLFADPDAAFQFVSATAQNSAFLLVAAGVTLVTYHVGVVLSRSSRGFLQSIHTIVYSTGVYLAIIFTLVWYLSQAESIVVADELMLNLQKEFIYFFIDLFGADLGLPSGRPVPVDASRITLQGQLALGGVVSAFFYYGYALYLGSRINHRASRLSSLLATGFVAVSPMIYISGSILVATNQLPM